VASVQHDTGGGNVARPARGPGSIRPARRVRRRIGWALLAVAFAVALVWSLEPFGRREVLFERDVPLVAGTELTGTFTPNLAAGFTYAELRFPAPGSSPSTAPDPARKEFTERLLHALGGGLFGSAGPAGLRVATTIHAGDTSVLAETTDDSLSGSWMSESLGVYLGSFRARAEVEHRVVVRLEHVGDALREFSARLVVANGGDWWSYRWLEQMLRPVLAGFALVLGVGLWWLATWLVDRRSRRRAAGRPG
jgi:hypothetical protein